MSRGVWLVLIAVMVACGPKGPVEHVGALTSPELWLCYSDFSPNRSVLTVNQPNDVSGKEIYLAKHLYYCETISEKEEWYDGPGEYTFDFSTSQDSGSMTIHIGKTEKLFAIVIELDWENEQCEDSIAIKEGRKIYFKEGDLIVEREGSAEHLGNKRSSLKYWFDIKERYAGKIDSDEIVVAMQKKMHGKWYEIPSSELSVTTQYGDNGLLVEVDSGLSKEVTKVFTEGEYRIVFKYGHEAGSEERDESSNKESEFWMIDSFTVSKEEEADKANWPPQTVYLGSCN